MKGVEEGGVGLGEAAAGRKEAGAGTEVDPSNSAGKLPAPLGWTGLT